MRTHACVYRYIYKYVDTPMSENSFPSFHHYPPRSVIHCVQTEIFRRAVVHNTYVYMTRSTRRDGDVTYTKINDFLPFFPRTKTDLPCNGFRIPDELCSVLTSTDFDA